MQVARELDDQDGVLGRQSDGGEQADLEIDIVRVACEQCGGQRTENTERYDENDRERNGPAFVQRREAQEHDQHGDGIQKRSLRARELFLQRQARPLEADSRWQLLHQTLHGLDRIAGAAARGRLALDLHRGDAVIAFELRRSVRPFAGRERRDRHHHALVVAHVVQAQIGRSHAELLIGLYEDALDASVGVQKVVDEVRAPGDREGLIDVAETHAERTGFLAIDFDSERRVVAETVGTHEREGRVLIRQGQQLVAGLHELRMPEAAAILQFHIESRCGAELADRRRIDGNDHGRAVLSEVRREACDQRLYAQVLALAHIPVLEAHEHQALILSAAGEVEAIHLEDRIDHPRLVFEQIVADIAQRNGRTALCRSGRTLHEHEDVALILIGQERCRQMREHPRDDADRGAIDQKPAARARNDFADPAHVAVATAFEGAIEPAEEARVRHLRVSRGLEQARAQRGCESQRHEHRQQHRRHDGE